MLKILSTQESGQDLRGARGHHRGGRVSRPAPGETGQPIQGPTRRRGRDRRRLHRDMMVPLLCVITHVYGAGRCDPPPLEEMVARLVAR